MVDARALKDSFAKVATHGDQVPLFFYSHLFLSHPEVRDLFPLTMAGQRDKLVAALGRVVSNVDNLDALVPFLRQLGVDHRKFGALSGHYPAVGASLLATLEHFLGPDWTPLLASDWLAAYNLVAQVMTEAAAESERLRPAWWEAEVLSHDRRTVDIAVVRVRPNERLPYVAGQALAVESGLRPRLWRYYSPANAPREDNEIEFHIRLVGGAVSSALVQALRPGDVLRLGPPVGTALQLRADSKRDILMIAGGTGLAPMRAMIEQLERSDGQRRVQLYLGVRGRRELYDSDALLALGQRCPWLTVITAVSDDPTYLGERSTAVEAALRGGSWHDHDIYVCGSTSMVAGTTERLVGAGVAGERIFVEDFDPAGYAAAPVHEGMGR